MRGIGSAVALARADRDYRLRGVPGRTCAGHRLQIDLEAILGNEGLIASLRHLRDEGAMRLGKLFAGLPIAERTIPDRLFDLDTSIRLRLFDDVQRLFVIVGVARQHLGSDDQLALGIYRDDFLMPSNAFGRALAPVPHMGIVNRYHPILAVPVKNRSFRSPFGFLQQDVTPQLGHFAQLRALRIVGRKSFKGLAHLLQCLFIA